jgi:N-methylhydantoinase A
VGPRSAGAQPGPACYGRGGTEPTVTDAAAYLGMLGHGLLADGLRLDVQKAEGAIASVADQLGIEPERLAQGVLEIAVSNMANAITGITMERGEDVRDATAIVFGGAGPLFGTLLAHELAISTVVVPEHAGNFSALSLLDQDLSQALSRTLVRPLGAQTLNEAGPLLRELAAALEPGDSNGHVQLSAALDLRFEGQDHNLTIPVEFDGHRIVDDVSIVGDRFRALYRRTYGQEMTRSIHVSTLRLTARNSLPPRPARRIKVSSSDGGGLETVTAHSFELGQLTSFSVRTRESLPIGSAVEGPLIIEEPTTTTYVDANFTAELDAHGDLWITGRTA